MTQSAHATTVFTPTQTPSYTYVERARDFERELRNALKTPNLIVSLSGPSKSGKSVLLQKVVGGDNLIRIFGSQIKSPESLWDAVLDWMEVPSSRGSSTQNSTGQNVSGGGSVTIGIPGAFSAGGNSNIQRQQNETMSQSATYGRGGLTQVAKEIANSDFVVFVDDFHYMERAIQAEIAKQIKAAAELGIRICIASVPHRADDAVRANPELRGRVRAVDMNYWEISELEQIAIKGFDVLGLEVEQHIISRMAKEACGSPQLMQSFCLQTCFQYDVESPIAPKAKIYIPTDDLNRILDSTSAMADFSTLLEKMHEGPKVRGSERKEYEFIDGTKGDVYRAILLAIATEPPSMTIPYSSLISRVSRVCVNEAPSGSSVSQACSQIDQIASEHNSDDSAVHSTKPFEWDTTSSVETIHIAEPYFLFYLRSANLLRKLGNVGKA